MASRPVSADSKRIGSTMRAVIFQQGITQEQAYLRLELGSQAVLHNYLMGKREIPLAVIKKFHKEFGVPMNVLWGETDAEYLGAEAGMDENLVAHIIEVLDHWLDKRRLWMKPSDKAKVISGLYKDNQRETDLINAALSMLHRVKSEMFLPKNNSHSIEK
jgi:hypothetical protein